MSGKTTMQDGAAQDEAAWTALRAELDAWAAAGQTARFWWRDDDATRPGPLLDRLLALAGRTPLALAVIPAAAQEALAARLDAHDRDGGAVAVLQHGYGHASHAPETEKKAEYGAHRPPAAMLAELAIGRARMLALFGDRFRPVLVPPWNRIADGLVWRLGESGLAGLSRFGPRRDGEGDAVVNTHIDILDWHGSRGFVGDRAALGAAVAHLAAKREGRADAGEPTGLLSHHRDHDEACWTFLGAFRDAVDRHPAAQWEAGP